MRQSFDHAAGVVSLEVRGETLILHPERAVEWRERRTLLVADTHFGKSSLFGRHGLAVPDGTDEADLARLGDLAARRDVERIVVLGDFLHGAVDARDADAARLARWCEAQRPREIWVIAGNHDRHSRDRWRPPAVWIEGAHHEGPFVFTHEARGAGVPAAAGAEHGASFTLSGHVHPVVRLRGLRKKSARVPVFWQHAGGLILPAFGGFTGGQVVEACESERLFAVGPDRVVPFAYDARSLNRRRTGYRS